MIYKIKLYEKKKCDLLVHVINYRIEFHMVILDWLIGFDELSENLQEKLNHTIDKQYKRKFLIR
jgi:hypothetical protein